MYHLKQRFDNDYVSYFPIRSACYAAREDADGTFCGVPRAPRQHCRAAEARDRAAAQHPGAAAATLLSRQRAALTHEVALDPRRQARGHHLHCVQTPLIKHYWNNLNYHFIQTINNHRYLKMIFEKETLYFVFRSINTLAIIKENWFVYQSFFHSCSVFPTSSFCNYSFGFRVIWLRIA